MSPPASPKSPDPTIVKPGAPWRRRLALTLAALALLAQLVWLAGRLFTDRTHVTQYLYWIPTIAAIGVAGVLILLGALVAPRGGRARSRRLALLGLVGMSLYAVFAEFRLHTLSRRPGASSLRVLFWNLGVTPPRHWHERILAERPDVVLTRPGGDARFEEILSGLSDGERPAHFLYQATFCVISRYPITKFSVTPLNIPKGAGLDPRADDLTQKFRDPGRAMMLELDTTEALGRPMIVWIIDLPSDLSLWRLASARRAAQTLRSFSGPVYVPGPGTSQWIPAPPSDQRPFASPDMIVGDFNTPRGSASIREITGSLESAFDLAGVGYAATYPASFPLWHLDQCFLAKSLRATGYRIVPAPFGTHRMQVIDLAP